MYEYKRDELLKNIANKLDILNKKLSNLELIYKRTLNLEKQNELLIEQNKELKNLLSYLISINDLSLEEDEAFEKKLK